MWHVSRTRGASAKPAAQRTSRHSPSRGGFTALEAVITLALVAMLALMVERTVGSLHESERTANAMRRAVTLGQRLVHDVHDQVAGSRRLFGNDTVGLSYLDGLDLSRDPLLSGARLPEFDEDGALGPDTAGDPRTGNVLLFAREADAAQAVANPATGAIRLIDVYRFVCVYPRTAERTLVPGTAAATDLVLWRSVPYPSLAQIQKVTDPTERAQVVSDLVLRFGFTHAWDPGAAADAAFFEMDEFGTVSSTPEPDPLIAEDILASERGRLVYADVQLAATDPLDARRKALFTVEDPEIWAPMGFEVKVAGASGSRKVWLRLVVEAHAHRGAVLAQDFTVVASTRDL